MYLFHREFTMASRILKINCEKIDSRIYSLLTSLHKRGKDEKDHSFVTPPHEKQISRK